MTQGPPKTSGRTLDHVAGVYDFLSPLMLFGVENRLSRRTIDLLNLHGDEKILDIGCGTGTLTIELARRLNPVGSMVVGLDAAPRMIDVARKKAGELTNIRFDVGIAEKLDYPDASFDAAVSTFFFHHINFDLKTKALGEMYRVLKPGATAIVVDVDVPTHWFGAWCAWCGYVLFRQDEIRENIRGQFRLAMSQSPFSAWQHISTHLGYISIFKLVK